MLFQKTVFQIFFNLILLIVVNQVFGQLPAQNKYLRERLETERNITSYRNNLKDIFAIGDSQIDDLISALNDSNKNIKFNAELMIRYLGNKKGMDAITEISQKSGRFFVNLPIPLPLREWDYQFLKSAYLAKPFHRDEELEAYLFALCFDKKLESKAIFEQIIKTANGSKIKIDKNIYLNTANVGIEDVRESDLAQSLLQKCIFLDKERLRLARASLIGMNFSKDKALIKIFINGGPLATETYHVVIYKDANIWKFYSITMTSNS